MGPSLLTLCCDGTLEEVRAALAGGEDVNKRSAVGGTGLMWAAWKGREAVIELLLQQPGLDVNLSGGPNSQTALHMACIKGHAGIVRRLLVGGGLILPFFSTLGIHLISKCF